MALTLLPSTPQEAVLDVPICFSASATATVPQEDLRNIDLGPSGTNWVYATTAPLTNTWKKVSGANNTWDAPAIVSTPISPLQTFRIEGSANTFFTPGPPNNNSHCSVGIIVDDDPNKVYSYEFLKYCNSNNTSCNATSGSNWIGTVRTNVTTPTFKTTNFNEIYRVRSDGNSLYYENKTAGIWVTDYVIPLPAGTYYKFIVNGLYVQNEITNVVTFKGSFFGNVPLTYSAPLGGTLIGSGNNQCFSASTPGLYEVCIDSDYDDPLCVGVTVGELYFTPQDLDCGSCVFTDTEVRFNSNGGYYGTLVATSGTVLDSLTWKAPSFPTVATLTYTIGDYEETCEIQVVPRLEVVNVNGLTIEGLLPGDTFQLITNYDQPVGTVQWYNLTCPNIVSPTGLITIPPALPTNCFGALDCWIRVILVDIEGEACDNLTADIPTTPVITVAAPDSESEGTVEWLEAGGCGFGYNYIDLHIITDPVYPTPDQGGPQYLKWKAETPDFRVVVNTFEGGCDETYIRNKVPVYRWTVRYDGLPYDQPCAPLSCCDETQGVVDGFSPEQRNATRLDEFWNLVYGTYGYFTLVEPRTGRVWRKVRFEEQMGRDHINWRTVQSRDVSMIWNPCCDLFPQGGTCSHLTTALDLVFPTAPQNIQGTVFSPYWIQVIWQAAVDNVGIQGYELEINGQLVDVGHTLTYNHRPVVPYTVYTYRVRAYDFQGNRSLWSAFINVTPTEGEPLNVMEGIDNVVEGVDNVVD